MTEREKIIATAFTGFMFVDGSDIGKVYAYEAEKVGHEVNDIMHASEGFEEEVRQAVKDDFIQMVKANETPNVADETGNIFDNLISMAENRLAGMSKISMNYRGWNCSVEVKKPVSKKRRTKHENV